MIMITTDTRQYVSGLLAAVPLFHFFAQRFHAYKLINTIK